MTETLCNSGAVKLKAGTNATILTASQYTQLINQAEGDINTITRYDWVSNFSSVAANSKKVLEGVCSDLAAMFVISYDMGVFNSRFEAQTMLDVLRDAALRGLSVLKDQNQKDFLI